MADIREEIARIIFKVRYRSDMYTWADMSDFEKNEFYVVTDQILDLFPPDIIAELEKPCPACFGQGEITGADLGVPTNATAYFCEACKGTGRKLFDWSKWVELDDDQEVPSWQFYSWSSTRQDESMRLYQTGKITKEEHNNQFSEIHNEELAIYKKAQQDMVKDRFRRIKE